MSVRLRRGSGCAIVVYLCGLAVEADMKAVRKIAYWASVLVGGAVLFWGASFVYLYAKHYVF